MLSVIIICCNEASVIGRCLDSVSWADDIVVFDSGSRDDTVAICRRHGARVFETDWPGFGPQKQLALEQARGDWVLSLDADEWVTPVLRDEILATLASPVHNGYWIPRASSYCGRTMRHSGWWPDEVLRLFRRDSARFSDDLVHERVIVEGATGRLREALQHEAYRDLDEVLEKINRYSTLAAQQAYQAGARASLGKALNRGLWTFCKTYFFQLGFLDGREGLMLAISNAEGSYYKYLKLAQWSRTLPR